MLRIRPVAVLLPALAALLPGQSLLKDVSTLPPTSDPGSFPTALYTVAAQTFFQAQDAAHGAELWVSDGTATGTRLVLDLEPGAGSSWPRAFTTFQGLAYFTAETAGHGVELWRSDGTSAGTRLVADLNPGSAGSSPDDFEVLGARMLFRATVAGVGRELFVTDGTTAGTQLVLDVWPGPDDSGPLDLAVLGNLVYFAAEEPVHGSELWVSDGTAAGTRLFADLEGGATGSYPRFMTPLGTQLLFAAATAATGIELWRTDGTATGTTLLMDLNPGPSHGHPFFLVPVGNLVWFQGDDGVRGEELWVTDGTTTGTRMVADVFPGSTSSRPEHFTRFGTQVLFTATAPGVGREVHLSDGTAAGTRLVLDIQPGSVNGMHHPSTTDVFHPLGARVVFTADDGVHGVEPWVTDGSAAGTLLLADVNPGSASGSTIFGEELAVLGSEALFRGYEPTTPPGRGPELWHSDGTPTGTAMLVNLAKPTPRGSDPRGFAELFDQVLFRAIDDSGTSRPWISDGTSAGTRLLADVPVPFVYPGLELEFVPIGNQMLFTAAHAAHGLEPWISDGTAAGTRVLLDIVPGTGQSRPNEYVRFRERVWFVASTATHGRELWVTDGTPAGTTLFADLLAGSSGSDPVELTVAGELLFFAARTWTPGHELWCTDGTQAGTRQVYPLLNSGARIAEIVAVGPSVLFSADDRVHGMEPWLSDGSTSGTRLLLDVRPGAQGSEPRQFEAFSFGEIVWMCVFSADDGVHGREPWIWNMLSPDAVLLRDITPGPLGSDPDAFVTLRQGVVLFAAADRSVGGSGRELWITAGTTDSTLLVLDLSSGAADGLLPGAESRLTAAGSNGRVLFAGHDGVHGVEPWVTNGTAAGTRMLADVWPGSASSAPAQFAVAGEQAYFAANDPLAGREPFALRLTSIGAGYARPVGAGCSGSSGRSPILTGKGWPTIGQILVLGVEGARPTTLACTLVGLGPTPMPVGNGCTTYFPMQTVLAYPMSTDSGGRASRFVSIANDASLIGLFVHAQAFVADPGAAWQGAVAFTNALQILLGS